MNSCSNCGEDTLNPRFCKRSCANAFNNRGVRRHGEKPAACPCGNQLHSSKKKYCSLECRDKYGWLEVVAVIEDTGDAVTEWKAKRYLLWRDGHKCSECGLTVWGGQKIPIVLDHINGRANNNRIQNIRLLCCNCDALTPTYKAKNKGNGTRLTRK